jgi:hypothetical protein
MNLGNYPHWYECGHFFFGEGKNGVGVQELDDSFHNARFSVVWPISGQKTNGWQSGVWTFVSVVRFPGNGKLRIFWE